MEQSLVSPEILKFTYYQDKIPLYLRDSDGFLSHIRIWYYLLTGNNDYNGLLPSWNQVFTMLDIFDPDYFNNLENIPGYTSTKCDILDKLASLFGLARAFTVSYYDSDTSQDVTTTLNLSNEELAILIKGQIIRNNFDGSREQAEEFYSSAGLKIFSVTDSSTSAKCKLILVQNVGEYSNNILALFKAGLLHIPSMGVQYIFTVQTYTEYLSWDSGYVTRWNRGKWDV